VGDPEQAGTSVVVCVFCSSSERIDPAFVDLAALVGTHIGLRGWSLVTGGGSISMMGAVSRGARAAGGHTVGVIPRALVAMEVADHDAAELVVTDDMRTRKATMDGRADAFLALPGGIGTLEELLEIWVARSLGMHDKPVVVLDPSGVFAPLKRQVDELVATGFVRSEAAGQITWTATIDEALDAIASGLAGIVGLGAPATGAPVGPAARPEPSEVLEAEG
jgi:uncharacterized protein (TIGR00730 family)